MKKIIYIIYILPLIFSGCIPDESPVEPYDRGDVVSTELEIGNDYLNQIYFNLSANSVAAENRYDVWELGFDCYPDSFNIILNTANFEQLQDMGKKDFEAVTSYDPDAFKFDSPAGFKDSTAIGKWWVNEGDTVFSKGHVYVLDLGQNEIGLQRGFKKFTLDIIDFNTYRIIYSELDNSDKDTAIIEKDPNRNFVNFSLITGEILKLEPEKDNWDLLFTKHTELLEFDGNDKGYLPYSVVSVLLNQRYTEAASFVLDSNSTFNEVAYEWTDTLEFSSRRNAVGHEWKYYDLDQGYIVFPELVYIVRDVEGFLYKLHFIEYYNESGEKGYPEFEFKKL